MNNEKQKPKGPLNGAPDSPKRETVGSNISGRVKHDDRGNAIWEWAVATGKFGGDSAAQRIKKLDAELSLADDTPPAATDLELVKHNPLGTVKGYSPYDSGVLAKTGAPRKKKDLRKLSEWLKLKKQADDSKTTDK